LRCVHTTQGKILFVAESVTLAHVDTYALNLILCQAAGPWWQTEHQSNLVLCYDGELVLDSEFGRISMQQGELVVVPKGLTYRLSGVDRALVLSMQRHEQPGLPLPD